MMQKIETKILDKSISAKMYIFYTFICVSALISFPFFSKYPVDNNIKTIVSNFKSINFIIQIVFYVFLYRTMNDKDLSFFAYAFIPLCATLRLLLGLIIFFPLMILSVIIITKLDLNFGNWNAINSTILTTTYNFLFYILLYKRVKNIINKIPESE